MCIYIHKIRWKWALPIRPKIPVWTISESSSGEWNSISLNLQKEDNLGRFSFDKKIPPWISGNFQWWMDNLARHTEIFGNSIWLSSRNFRFNGSLFEHFSIFWKLSQEISIPFVPVRKLSKLLVEWEAPLARLIEIFEKSYYAEFLFHSIFCLNFPNFWLKGSAQGKMFNRYGID